MESLPSVGWTNTANNPVGSQQQSLNNFTLTLPFINAKFRGILSIQSLCFLQRSFTFRDYCSTSATTCLTLVEAVLMRSHCHRRPCNYCAAILRLDDALSGKYYLTAVLSSIVQDMDDGQHLCEALIPAQAPLPPGRSRMVAWSLLSRAIRTESIAVEHSYK